MFANSSVRRFSTSVLVCCMVAVLTPFGAYAATPQTPVPSEDSFEGLHIFPFWSVTQQSGTVSLSTDKAYSGPHSLKFSSATGTDRNMAVKHVFSKPTKGTVSVAYFDDAPGQQTLYQQLSLSLSTNSTVSASVGTMDFDAACYEASFGATGGPNALCGAYPQLTTAPVARAAGWHRLAIVVGQTTVSISIDDVVVYSAAANVLFDTVQLSVSGPAWRPNTIAYFDDFKFTPLTY